MITAPDLAYFRHNKHAPATAIASGPVSFHDLTILLKGTLEYTINHQSITLHDGDMILIRSGSLRERKESETDADYVSFNFHSDETLDLPEVIRGGVTGELRLMLASCDEINQKYYPDHEEQISHLLAALLLTVKNHLKRETIHPLISEIIRYLRENMSQKITLADIGQHTFFSPVYCDAIFKKEMGTSIIDYLLEERIHTAKQLLVEGGLSFRQIAETVGFPDYNYFARTFKKRTGYTPGQYRQMILTPNHNKK